MVRPVVLACLAVLWLSSCDALTADGTPPGLEPASQAAEAPGLPAWETPGEQAVAFKGDEHDDYREAHPELYGVTAPPSKPVRSFAEYDAVQAMMMRPGGKIGAFHAGILEGAAGRVPRIVIFHEPGQEVGLADQIQDGLGLELAGFQFLEVENTDAIWTRDYGPISHITEAGEVGLVDFRYYHGRHWDDAIPTRMAEQWGTNVFRPSMSYEGGNFMADAAGTCYATEKIYQQNPGHSKQEIDRWMLEYAGCSRVVSLIWPKGLGTGHIDMFGKLMDQGTVILGAYDPVLRPENAQILDDNAGILEAVVTEGGGQLDVVRIPLPWDETGIWYTYTNSLILNDVVLVPVYSKFAAQEAQALEVYDAVSGGRELVTVNADSIISSGGAIHCVTMTMPAGPAESYQARPVQLCPQNELDDCGEQGPCWGLPLEGACAGALLQVCGEDGYPHSVACDECCAWDPDGNGGMGWYDCLEGAACASCVDECDQVDDTGCSAGPIHAWACTMHQGCLRRIWTWCEEDAACDPGTGLCDDALDPPMPCEGDVCEEPCEHQCEVSGARLCDDAGLATLVCRLDEQGCLRLEEQELCPEGTACMEGTCVTPPEAGGGDAMGAPDAGIEEPVVKGSGGCGVGDGRSGAGGVALMFMLLLLICGRAVSARCLFLSVGGACRPDSARHGPPTGAVS